MKRLPLVILVFAVLAAVVAGCSHSARYDGRLVAADSLMQVNPDSSLAIVEGLCRDSLATEGDRAYHDLLLTQARYRCYVTATSDSDINRALAYYRAHPKEREKLTRANIYKGAVMDELGLPDSAMLYYKHAEAVADPTDYFNLGYINLRISDLFLDQVSKDSSVIIRLHRAIWYFEKLPDTTRLIQALGNLGSFTGYSQPDSAKQYLWRAINLARRFDPTQQYSHESTLAGVYFFQNEYAQANALAMDVLRHGSEYSFESQFYYYAAMSYIGLGKLDSAKYVLSVTPTPETEVDSLTYYNLTAEISKAEGKPYSYAKNVSHSKDMLGNILNSSREIEMLQIESEFDREKEELRHDTVNRRNITIISIGLVLLILLSLIICRQFKKNKAFRQEMDTLTAQMEQSIATLEECQRQASDPDLNSILRLRRSAIQELYQAIRIRIDDENKVRKVVPLSSFLKMMYERNALLDLKLNDSFWNKMRTSVDQELNGIVTYVEQHYTKLSQRDIKFFCLFCAGISPQIIKMCMNITSAKTATNYRTLIIRKMGLDMSFDEFIDEYMAGNLK